MNRIMTAAALALLSTSAQAATRNVACSGNITSALQSAISASSTGDIVNIGAGSCSMNPITITDKNITIQGQGKTGTLITATGGFGTWITNGSNSPQWRLANMKLSGPSTSSTFVLTVWANQAAMWRGPYRIDHVTFDYPNNRNNVYVNGPVWGLFDHDDFSGGTESTLIFGLVLATEGGGSINTLNGNFGNTLPYVPGAAEYTYIEDSTCTGSGTAGVALVDTDYSGARLVIRHNAMSGCALYSHWSSGTNINSLWWEVYNNTMTWNLSIVPPAMRIQGGGTGLIYNNTINGASGFNRIELGEQRTDSARTGSPIGTCNGSNNWDGNAGDPSAPGWPCITQTGRQVGQTIAQIQAGMKQASFPLYMWNNGTQAACASGSGSCDNSFSTILDQGGAYVKSASRTASGYQGDVDFCIRPSQPAGCGTHTLNYTPFAYPYPLTAQGMPDPTGKPQPPTDTTPPSVPSGLTAMAASSTQINLAWSASTGNPTGYQVLRNGAQVATSPGTSYNDAGLMPSTRYTYTIKAYDAANNVSATSPSVSATTSAEIAPPVDVPTVDITVVGKGSVNITVNGKPLQ